MMDFKEKIEIILIQKWNSDSNWTFIYEGLKMDDDTGQMYLEIAQKENYYTPRYKIKLELI